MRTLELQEAMIRRGLIPDDADPVPYGGAGRPWYVSAVLGGAGWLASLFGFLFLAMWFQPNTALGFAGAGVVLIGGALALYHADRDSAFFEQLALALSLAGQLSLLWAVGDGTESATITAGFAALLSAAMVRLVPNHFARFLSTLFACVAWALTLRFAWWGEESFIDPDQAVALVPALLGWIVAWGPVAFAAWMLLSREPEWMATEARRIARPVLSGLLFALAVGTWTSEPFAALAFWTPTGQTATNWLVIWPLLGVGAALFAAVQAFRVRHNPLLGVAIAGALLHVVQFYFVLGVTLVVKSYIMLFIGAALLFAARMRRLEAP